MGLHREKLKDAIVYIGAHSGVRSLGLTKLYKLLYFADMMSIRPAGALEWDWLSESEIEALDLVCRKLGRASAITLSEKSQAEPAWIASSMLEKLSDELMMYGAAEDPDGL